MRKNTPPPSSSHQRTMQHLYRLVCGERPYDKPYDRNGEAVSISHLPSILKSTQRCCSLLSSLTITPLEIYRHRGRQRDDGDGSGEEREVMTNDSMDAMLMDPSDTCIILSPSSLSSSSSNGDRTTSAGTAISLVLRWNDGSKSTPSSSSSKFLWGQFFFAGML